MLRKNNYIKPEKLLNCSVRKPRLHQEYIQMPKNRVHFKAVYICIDGEKKQWCHGHSIIATGSWNPWMRRKTSSHPKDAAQQSQLIKLLSTFLQSKRTWQEPGAQRGVGWTNCEVGRAAADPVFVSTAACKELFILLHFTGCSNLP